MKQILSEKNLVVVLFVMVLITFSLAQEDSKKMERIYSGAANAATSLLKQEKDPKPVSTFLNSEISSNPAQ